MPVSYRLRIPFLPPDRVQDERRLETYTNRLKQLEDITNSFKGVDKSFAIQAGREIRIMVVPEQVSDDDMVLLARDISKQIEAELEYPGQIKVNVIRESRVVRITQNKRFYKAVDEKSAAFFHGKSRRRIEINRTFLKR